MSDTTTDGSEPSAQLDAGRLLPPPVGQRRDLNFTVDAALLQELGERLVGKPFTALAELVKNSYDADAENVVIRFGEDEIEVADDGHGMDYEAFVRKWMRVGSSHKRDQERSRAKGRPLTGSKGVGRLAAQFLSTGLRVISTSREDASTHLEVGVNWRDIPKARDLQDVQVSLTLELGDGDYPGGSPHGTRIIMSGLRQSWGAENLRELAQQLWFLQPPEEIGGQFHVEVESADKSLARSFDSQMRAILEVWDARLTGRLQHIGGEKQIHLILRFRGDDEPIVTVYPVADECPDQLDFDIRIYDLRYRQPEGITVGEARAYMNEYGGIHVYDAGFRLPHYGPDNDWLDIEFDHSHRLSKSKLLPDDLHISEGLNNLPTNSRLLGDVRVNTSHEASSDQIEPLSIAITRDRLTENSAYAALKDTVRWSLDFYAMQVSRRRLANAEKDVKKTSAQGSLGAVTKTLESLRNDIPEPAFRAISSVVDKANKTAGAERERFAAQTSLMATLATAGMAALAYEHETSKQLLALEHVATSLESFSPNETNITDSLTETANSLREWIEHARALRGLFGHLMDDRNRESKKLRVNTTVSLVEKQLGPLLRFTQIDTSGLDRHLRFPEASLSEWTAIFQNLFINSVNAMLDSDDRRIRVWSHETPTKIKLFVDDTGVGVDPKDSEELFEPFVRRLQLSEERRNLGLGGTGIGLTIVRMICSKVGCQARFVEPAAGYHTSLELSWENLN